jgi:hypothetical protein
MPGYWNSVNTLLFKLMLMSELRHRGLFHRTYINHGSFRLCTNEINTGNTRMCETAIRRRAPETTVFRIARFCVQSHIRHVRDYLAAEESIAVSVAQPQLNLHKS